MWNRPSGCSTVWYNLALGHRARDSVVAEQLQARRFWISGSVQGVGFRFFAVRAAQRIGLAGYTLNLRDGRVEVYAIGAPDQLAALRHELERGPRGAIVSDVTEEVAQILARYSDGFSIEYEP